MKLLLLMIPFLFLQSNADLQSQLKGKWEETTTKDQFVFNANGSVSVISKTAPEMRYTSYEVDDSKSPAWIDLNLEQGSQKLTFKGIIQIDDNNVMRLEIKAPGLSRPKEFSPYGERRGYNYELKKAD